LGGLRDSSSTAVEEVRGGRGLENGASTIFLDQEARLEIVMFHQVEKYVQIGLVARVALIWKSYRLKKIIRSCHIIRTTVARGHNFKFE
jgi:hypothetical protein